MAWNERHTCNTSPIATVSNEVFRRLDRRKTGYLGQDELRVFAEVTGFDGDDEEWISLFDEITEGFRLTVEGMGKEDFLVFAREFIEDNLVHEDEENINEFLNLFVSKSWSSNTPPEQWISQVSPCRKNRCPNESQLTISTRAPSLESSPSNTVVESQEVSDERPRLLIPGFGRAMAADVSSCQSYTMTDDSQCAVQNGWRYEDGQNTKLRALQAAWRRGGFNALYAEGFLVDGDQGYGTLMVASFPH